MANTPPLFGDLGKAARDIFEKGYGMLWVLSLRVNEQSWIAMCNSLKGPCHVYVM